MQPSCLQAALAVRCGSSPNIPVCAYEVFYTYVFTATSNVQTNIWFLRSSI